MEQQQTQSETQTTTQATDAVKNAEEEKATKNEEEEGQGFYGVPRAYVWIVAVAFASLGSTFVFGYCISVLNSPRQKIECFFLSTWLSDFKLSPLALLAHETKDTFLMKCPTVPKLSSMISPEDDSKLRWLYTMTQALWAMALAAGGMCTGFVVDRFGRRNCLIAANSLATLASLIIIPMPFLDFPILIYVVRILSGFHNGLTIPIQSMYATEIAPVRYRGAAGSCGQLSITIGIAIGGLVGLEQLLNREYLWVVAVALAGIPAVMSSMVLPFLPESPRFLYINRKDTEAAEAAIRRLCSEEDARHTIEDLRAEVKDAKESDTEICSIVELITKKRCRLALILGVVIVSVQQLSGINVVMQYSSIMLEAAGATKSSIPFLTLMLYVVNVLATVASMYMMDKFGRRFLYLLSLAIVFTSLLLIFFFNFFTPSAEALSSASSMQRLASAIVCALTFVFVVGFAIGLGSVSVMYISEIFQQRERGAANSICIAAMQICNLLVIVTFYNVLKLMQGFVYLLYVVPVAMGAVFCFFFMPETKERSVKEVVEELAEKM